MAMEKGEKERERGRKVEEISEGEDDERGKSDSKVKERGKEGSKGYMQGTKRRVEGLGVMLQRKYEEKLGMQKGIGRIYEGALREYARGKEV